MDADESGARYFFQVIGIAPAMPGVIDADNGHAGSTRLFNGDLRAAMDCDIAGVVAAINDRRNRGFETDRYRCARVLQFGRVGNGKNARQSGKRIPAKHGIDKMRDHGLCVFFGQPQRKQSPVAQIARRVR